MANDVLLNKAATIERCVGRAREEYEADPENFTENYTRQDAAILNIQRACEAAIDMGTFLVRRERLGLPQSARDMFTLLAESNWISTELAEEMKQMVGFRNIAVHDYRAMQIAIVIAIIEKHLDDFLRFSESLLQRASTSSA